MTAPIRVGIVCPYSWDVPGGVQQHAGDLAEALIAMGHQVSVLAPVGDGDHERPPYLVSAGRPVPVPYNGSVARISFGPRIAARVRRWITEGAFDILHIHEPAAPSVSLLACWAADGPIVATFHTSNPRSRAMAATSTALRAALEKINARVAVSEAARRTLVEHVGGDAVLIPNGVSVRRFAHAEPLPGWPGPGGSIGFLGRLDEPRKGLGVLLAAFARLAPQRPGLRLLVAGPGTADLSEVPERVRERVVLLGRLDDADKIRAYHSTDVFCAPNLGGESFGIVLTEAMSAGAAIVASDIPAFDAVLDGGRAGTLFRVGDPTHLAEQTAALLDDPRRRSRLSRAAHAAVSAYDWDTVAADIAHVYETVLTSTGYDRKGIAGVRLDNGPLSTTLLRRGERS